MPTVKLTDAAVDRYKAAPGCRIEYFDATLPGFGLRVAGPTDRTPFGRKSWVLFYRIGGKQKRLTLAQPYPALSLKDARKEVGEALQLIVQGIDPGARRAEVRSENQRVRETFGVAAEAFLKSGLRGKKGRPLASGYIAGTRRHLEIHVLPKWRDRPLASITRRDVVALLDAIAGNETVDEASDGKKPAGNSKAGRQSGGPISANRVLAAIRLLFNWAVSRDKIEANPCTLVQKPGEERKRERALSQEEIRDVWVACCTMGAPAGDFLRMALLTGQRRTEVAEMRWGDVDIEAQTWTLAAEKTKAGRGHVVPLSQPAIDLLKATKRKSIIVNGALRDSPFVFTTEGAAPINSYSTIKEQIDAKISGHRTAANLDQIEPWRIHDLRRTAATEMGRLGIPEFIIGKVLNHSSRGVTGQVYNRYEYLTEKQHALDTWAAYLERLVAPPTETATPAN